MAEGISNATTRHICVSDHAYSRDSACEGLNRICIGCTKVRQICKVPSEVPLAQNPEQHDTIQPSHRA